MHWLLAGYMWLYVHRPFEVWPWLADLRVERIYMLVTIAVWAFSQRKTWTRNRLNTAFAFFFLVTIACWFASPYPDPGFVVLEDLFKIGVFYVLVMSSIHDESKLRFLVGAFLVCTALYMGHSLREYQNGRHSYKMGTARMIGVDSTFNDPNTFAASCLYALPLVVPFWRTTRRRLVKTAVVGYGVLTATCILLTGSRTALFGLIVMTSIALAFSKRRLSAALTVAVLAPLAWNMLPADRQERYMTLIDPSRGPQSAQDSAESRHDLFLIAYHLFADQPLTGVGPGGFLPASGTGMVAHTLYGQLCSELGLLGIIAFLGILYCFWRNARDVVKVNAHLNWRTRAFEYWASVAVLVTVVLLLVLGLGGDNLYRYTWAWYGAFQALAFRFARQNAAEGVWQESATLNPLEHPDAYLAMRYGSHGNGIT